MILPAQIIDNGVFERKSLQDFLNDNPVII